MSGPGDELLWDNGPALRRAPHFPLAPFQPFTCSAGGSSRAHELKRHATTAAADAKAGAFMSMSSVSLGAASGMHDVGLGGLPVQDDDDAVPWLHCPVVDDSDSDTAPLPPDYCGGLLSDYSGLPAAPAVSHSGVVPTTRAVLPETAAKQNPPIAPGGGESVMNFTFFSRPLQRPQASTAASPSNPIESTVVQTAANLLRSTPLFSEQRMAWLRPPKGARTTAVAPPAPQAPLAPDHHHVETAATVTQHRLQPEARPPDEVTAATAAVTTSSVCSANGDRIQPKRSSHQPAECSFSQDEDLDDEPGSMRRSAARSTKRTRTAEVHNLSERRRRDRINEKMRALQELIPNCNKIDKASMLEEAIEYLKTLQLQVQMMSMGTGLCVPPMLLPAAAAMQHLQMPLMAHFPHLGAMGLGFGMGAAFDMVTLPRFAGAQFPCPVFPGAPPMAMPPGSMFGMPGQAMPSSAFPHMAQTALAEQMEAAALARGGAGAGDHPPVPVAPQGDQKLQHPKQT